MIDLRRTLLIFSLTTLALLIGVPAFHRYPVQQHGFSLTTKPLSPAPTSSKRPLSPSSSFHENASLTKFTDSNPKNKRLVAIIGVNGFVGARFHDTLMARLSSSDSSPLAIIGFDRVHRQLPPAANHSHVHVQAAKDISKEDMAAFDVVVYLGDPPTNTPRNARAPSAEHNEDDVVVLATRMDSQQTLVFASSYTVLPAAGTDMAHGEDSEIGDEALADQRALSFLHRERALKSLVEASPSTTPRLVGIRFGEIAGVSRSQRVDTLEMELTVSALLNDRIFVSHTETLRPVLWLDDAVRALEAIVMGSAAPTSSSRYELYHLASYHATVARTANEVGARTGAYIERLSHSPGPDRPGVQMSTNKFLQDYPSFGSFQGTAARVSHDLVLHMRTLVLGRDDYNRAPASDQPLCRVCGEKETSNTLRIMELPTRSARQTLVRCRGCHHVEIDVSLNSGGLPPARARATTQPSVLSWVADKVATAVEGSHSDVQARAVFEFECHEGELLRLLNAKGIAASGTEADDAAVLLAKGKGLVVQKADWSDVSQTPKAARDASSIVMWDTVSRTRTPVEFLNEVRTVLMSSTSLLHLLVTTSATMFDQGQFDLVHEHRTSLFSVHSLRSLAHEAGLSIIAMERPSVSIGLDESYIFVTLAIATPERSGKEANVVETEIVTEVAMGLDQDWFYRAYAGRANATRHWMLQQLGNLQRQQYELVAVGTSDNDLAVARALQTHEDGRTTDVHLTRLFQESSGDDTNPISNSATVTTLTLASKLSRLAAPVVVVVLQWRDMDRVRQNVLTALPGQPQHPVLLLVPWPRATLYQADKAKQVFREIAHNPYSPPPLLSVADQIKKEETRRQIVLIGHFFNEALLISNWIRVHSPLFDRAVIFDYNSTDATRAILARDAPASWEVRNSRNPMFAALEVDKEVMDEEAKFPDAWKMALTVGTELLIVDHLRSALESADPSHKMYRLIQVDIVGDETVAMDWQRDLHVQRSVYSYVGDRFTVEWMRTFHLRSVKYTSGRHFTEEDKNYKKDRVCETGRTSTPYLASAFIMKMRWSPWPEVLQRKAQIGKKIPQVDVKHNRGVHHTKTVEEISQMREEVLTKPKRDLSHIYLLPPGSTANTPICPVIHHLHDVYQMVVQPQKQDFVLGVTSHH